MPLPPAHGLLGLAAVYAIRPRDIRIGEFRFLAVAGMLTLLPDIDIAYGLWQQGHPFVSHRAATHSFVFALIVSALTFALFHRSHGLSLRQGIHLWLTYFVAVLSHPLLDSLWPRYGVMLFWPFSTQMVYGPYINFINQFMYNLYVELFFEIGFGGSVLLLVLILNHRKLRLGERWYQLKALLFPQPEYDEE